MIQRKNYKKSFLIFLPLFLLISLLILLRSETYSSEFVSDEGKFYHYAENITNGFFTDSNNPKLEEGPGYPLFLAIPIALNFALPLTRAINIILVFTSCLYLFMILKFYINRKWALSLTYLFALYPPLIRWENLMYSESFMLLLLLGFSFHFLKCFNSNFKFKRNIILTIIFLGLLALTKIIFVYVITVTLALSMGLTLIPHFRNRYSLNTLNKVLLGSFLIISPYMFYTYQLTGKFFYFGTHGGRILYFRTTPYPNEFGNSFEEKEVFGNKLPDRIHDVETNLSQLNKNHSKIFQDTENLKWVQQDSVFKAEAIKNIKNYPKKYITNTIANASRLFFHFPFSYRIQNLGTLGYLIPNIFVVVLSILAIYPAIVRRKLIPPEIIILFTFSLIYLGGHILLGGRGRFLIPLIPIWIIFFSFIYLRILKIKIVDTLNSKE